MFPDQLCLRESPLPHALIFRPADCMLEVHGAAVFVGLRERLLLNTPQPA
jgi:hypothetical protein